LKVVLTIKKGGGGLFHCQSKFSSKEKHGDGVGDTSALDFSRNFIDDPDFLSW
jgi:hypothetical protein